MPNLRFFVRTTRKRPAVIRLYFSISRGVMLYAKTPYLIKPEVWDAKNGGIKKMEVLQNSEAEKLQQHLFDIEKHVYNAFNKRTSIPSKEWLQKVTDSYLQIQSRERETFVEYGHRYLNELRSGVRLGLSGRKMADSSIRSLRNCLLKVTDYQVFKQRKLDFEDIDIEFYYDFMLFLTNKEYTPNTNANIIKTIKIIMAAAKRELLHNNCLFRDGVFKAECNSSDTIYLSSAEVRAIEQLEFLSPEDKKLEISRDLFLIGIYTAQRYSDYPQINVNNIDTIGGVKVLRIVQQKTKNPITLPISQKLIAILEKYGDKSPYRNATLFGREIKMICQKAGVTQKIQHLEIRGGKKIVVEKAKYELVTSHTARRTGASLMYLDKIDMLSIMKITGHKTESQFLKYIRVTSDEIAVQLSKLDYFK